MTAMTEMTLTATEWKKYRLAMEIGLYATANHELDIDIAHFTEKLVIQSGGFSPKIIWEGTMIGIHY
jgi:hypothetical protein